MSTSAFYIGCAIWGYKDWVGDLFPAGSKNSEFLSLYSRRLTTVEGNTTFYATPKAEVVQRWAAETPSTFRFCCKLPRDISHSGSLAAGSAAALGFIERMQGLGERLGPMFIQLPPSYGPRQIDDLQAFLDAWPRDVQLGVEVRHPDFFTSEGNLTLNWLLADYDVARVMMDVRPIRENPLETGDNQEALDVARDRKPDVPLLPDVTAPFTMVRYIGHPTTELNYPYFDDWAERVAQWLKNGTQVYFFTHCPDDRYSPGLARQFYARLSQRTDIPPLPWDAFDEGLQQEALF